MTALIDTNVLVYRFDARFPEKQRVATELLRKGILDGNIRHRIERSWNSWRR